MRIADAIVKLLENNDIKYTFGVPASTFGGILDSLNESEIEYIITKNEAGATYSASKYADLSNKLGVCLLAGGVGVNNAMNGMADAQRNKTPMLIISGDVRKSYIGKGALQEFDNAKIVEGVTKYSVNIEKEEDILKEIQKAINISLTPPCGVTLVSIPYDLQMPKFDGYIELDKTIKKPENDEKALDYAIEEINKAKKGLILIGRGTRGLTKEIKELSEKLTFPIISTPNAKGIINSDYEYYIGNYGFCSADSAIDYVENEDFDCLLVLGSSLGQSATRDFKDVLVKGRKVIRVDWDTKEFNRVFNEDISVCYDLKEAIPMITNKALKKDNKFVKPEMNKPYVKNHTGVSLRRLYEMLPDIFPKDTCVVSDIGDFFNYMFKYMPIREDMDFQCGVNYACMGTGVAGAIGSYLSNPDKPYAVFVGDGGFYMNGMDILTAKEYNIPIMYFVINNSMLGLVKNGMKAIFGRKFEAKVEFEKNNISEIAKAMGIESVQITDLGQVQSLEELMKDRTAPLVVEVVTDGTEIFIDTDRLKKVD